MSRTTKTLPVDMKDKSFPCVCTKLMKVKCNVKVRAMCSGSVSEWSDKVKDIAMVSNFCTWKVCPDDVDWERKCFVFHFNIMTVTKAKDC